MHTVMLVDDEYMILRGLEKIIPWEELNLKLVGTAKNGREAWDLFEKRPADIIISDITMPLMTGLELLEELIKNEKKPLTVFLSGYQEFHYVKEGMALGAINYLLKPVNKEELIETLIKCIHLLEERKRQEEITDRILDSYISKWVNNTLSKEEASVLKIDGIEGFQVFYVSCFSQEFLEELKKESRVYLYLNNENHIIGILSNSTREESNKYFRYLLRKFEKQVQILVGAYVKESTHVYESYIGVMEFYNNYLFYNKQIVNFVWLDDENLDLSYKIKVEQIVEPVGPEIESVIQKINQLLELFAEEKCPVSQVKYLTILLISDIQRYFELWEDGSYQVLIENINNFKNIREIISTVKKLEEEIIKIQHQRSYSQLTQKALKMIYNQYQSDLMLKMVADALHVNVMYLGQVIRRETGRTFSQLVNEYRIKKSEELLLKTQKTVNEIAYEVGYSNVSYFHKNFKEIFLTTPKEFRENYNINVN